MESFNVCQGLIFAGCFALAAVAWDDDPQPSDRSPSFSSKAPTIQNVASFAATGKVRLTDVALAGERSANEVFKKLISVSRKPIQGDDHSFKSAVGLPLHHRGHIQLVFGTSDSAVIQSALRGARCIEAFVAPCWLPTKPVRVLSLTKEQKRAHAVVQESTIYLDPVRTNVGTAIHEMAHLIEYSHPEILHCSKLFIARRGNGVPIRRLSELTGDPSYADNEIAVAGNWPTKGGHAYTGKFYGSSLRDAMATEVISTGLERLLKQPRMMLIQDADFFIFLLLTLQLTPSDLTRN
jgi:hypothetical protein